MISQQLRCLGFDTKREIRIILLIGMRRVLNGKSTRYCAIKEHLPPQKKTFFYRFFSNYDDNNALTAFLLPPVYKSEVGILVEEQQIPENYVKSTITSYVEERIEMITKQVMSRSKLLGNN